MNTLLAISCGLMLTATPLSPVDGHVPQESLARMGLGNMTVMSDEQGRDVRGIPALYWVPSGATFEIQAFRVRYVFPWTEQPIFRP